MEIKKWKRGITWFSPTFSSLFFDTLSLLWACIVNHFYIHLARGEGILPEKLGEDVRPASQNSYPIYDQDMWYSLPYLWPDQKFETLLKTLPLNQNPVQTNV